MTFTLYYLLPTLIVPGIGEVHQCVQNVLDVATWPNGGGAGACMLRGSDHSSLTVVQTQLDLVPIVRSECKRERAHLINCVFSPFFFDLW